MSIVKASFAARMSVAACVTNSASAFVITDSPTRPLLGCSYASVSGVGCFPAAGLCVSPGILTLTSLVSSTFDASGQDIVTNAAFQGSLTMLAGTALQPINLTGTIRQLILGRTDPDELGNWSVELETLSLIGTVLGNTLTLSLSASND